MKIEIIYASETQLYRQEHDVPESCSVQCALESLMLLKPESEILAQFPEKTIFELPMGIFSKKIALSTILHAGDRLEIYRPLLIDPMTKRRLIALKTQKKK